MQCDACGTVARAMYDQGNGAKFCLDCHYKASQIRLQTMNHLVGQMNQARNQIEDIFGVPRTQGVQVPQPTYNIGGMSSHINVSDSIVGTINTGVVNSLNSSLEGAAINDGVTAEQLKVLAEGIGASTTVSSKDKEELLESISFLAQQVAIPKATRNKSMIKSALGMIKASVSVSSDLVTLTPIVIEIAKKLL
jgi:hypothetical protein